MKKPKSRTMNVDTAALIAAGALIWAIVLLTAAMETIELTLLIPKASFGRADEVSLFLSWGLIQVYGLVCYWSEQANQYHKHKAGFARRMGLIVQSLIAAVLICALFEGRTRAGSAVVLFFMATTAVAWRAWISSRSLDPNDQKIVDRLVDEEQRLIDQAHETQRKRIRDARFQVALAQVRTRIPASAGETQQVKWNVTRGQHPPVVYFLRNGNRIKIGTTTDLHQRIRRLALRSDDIALILPGGRDVERSHHKQFAALRVGNTEWFEDAEPLTGFIADQTQIALNQTKKDT